MKENSKEYFYKITHEILVILRLCLETNLPESNGTVYILPEKKVIVGYLKNPEFLQTPQLEKNPVFLIFDRQSEDTSIN